MQQLGEAIGHERKAEGKDCNRQPGKDRNPPGNAEIKLALGDHHAPFGGRRLDAKTKKTKRRSKDDRQNRIGHHEKCNNPNGHGHNYTLEVTVKGDVDPRSGFVVDLKQLKETMQREVLHAMDHRFLNKEVPEFFSRIPTTENLAIAIWQRLAPKLNHARLHRVRVYETPDLFVDFYGEA